MKRDKFTQQLHDKLAEHETPAPGGLWDDIEAALTSVGAGVEGDLQSLVPARSSQARFVTLRRWATAAAIAALIGGGGLVWWGMPGEEYRQEEAESMISMADDNSAYAENPELDKQNSQQGNGAELDKHNSLQRAATRRESRLSNSDTNSYPKQLSDSDTSGLRQAKDPAEVTEITEETTPNDQAGKDFPHDVQKGDALTTPSEDSQRTIPPVRRKTKSVRQNPSLNLYAMNGFGTKDNSNAVMMADALAEKYANTVANVQAARRQAPIYLTGYEEREHHHQPVSFGLSVSYPFTQRLSLTSGIVYTKMRSDFEQIIRTQQINKEQTLHYVGIPLGLNYRLWQLGARSSSSAKKHGVFTAYVSTGFQADWNVDARRNTEGVESHLEKDKMQWSVNASLGLQYNLMPQLALYAEPGISHYFDNGSNIQNFFKDKPTGLRLQVGIRMTIDKYW